MNLRPITRAELRERVTCSQCKTAVRAIGAYQDHDTGKTWCAGCALPHIRKDVVTPTRVKPQLDLGVKARVSLGIGLPPTVVPLPTAVVTGGREAIVGYLAQQLAGQPYIVIEYGDEN